MIFTTETGHFPDMITCRDANNYETLATAYLIDGTKSAWLVFADFGPYSIQRMVYDEATANVRASQFATLAYLVQCKDITPERALILMCRRDNAEEGNV